MSDERTTIEQWMAQSHAYRRRPAAARAEYDPTSSGNAALDSQVAGILLDTIQARLPTWIGHGEDGLVFGREFRPQRPRRIQLLPQHLLTINWADSGPGLSWPEEYHVTYVPALRIRCVTASADTDELLQGFTDLAIGWCRARGAGTYGVRSIVTDWWQVSRSREMHPWQRVIAAGSIPKATALAWRTAVWGKRVCEKPPSVWAE